MKTILYVEDVMFNRRLVRKCLKMMDYTYIEAVDGLSGVETARRENPDVILLDIHLPDINGIEVAKRIREIAGLEQVPIIALTADITSDVEEQCITGNFDAYLNKPISKSRLLRVIQQMLQSNAMALS